MLVKLILLIPILIAFLANPAMSARQYLIVYPTELNESQLRSFYIHPIPITTSGTAITNLSHFENMFDIS